MNIKRLLIASLLIISTIAQANTCREKYQTKIDNNTTVAMEMFKWDYTGEVIPVLGYYGGYLIFGTHIAAFAATSVVPLALVAEHLIEDAIKDANLKNMIRVINESQYQLQIVDRPVVNPAQKIIIPVDGKTKEERKTQRRQNRRANREANTIERANKKISKENSKSTRLFTSIFTTLQKDAPDTTPEEVALLILDADANEDLCNGQIRNIKKDLKLRSDFKKIEGNKKQQRQAAKYNKQIQKHNDKVFKLIATKELALKKHLIKFLKAQL
jgi:hypothetical protein